ncbi:alpha-ketoacid dehydrogenase subunit beta [bacterium]|nr:alpha-ketoacid dehydrogenase subunit beta [candidate division CSSED10-310 bacterium]
MTSNIKITQNSETEKLTLVQAVNRGLEDVMSEDSRVIVLGEDVGVNGGVFRATEGLMDKFGEDRVFDTPLAESGIVGTAIGLAIAGFRPVAEIQFMGFIYPAVNQIFGHAARMRNRSRGRYFLPMVIRMPYGGGIHAPEHHSESYESMLANTPGLTVVIPSNPIDAKGLLIAAIMSNDPVIFMEPKRIYRAFREEVPKGVYQIPLRQANVVQQGKDVTIVAYGAMMRPVLEARDTLEREGISTEIIDVRTIVPLDGNTIVESVKKTGRLVIVHEGPRTSGFGAEISAHIMEHALLHLLAPVQRVTGFDTIFPYSILEHHYLPDKRRVIDAVRQTMAF